MRATRGARLTASAAAIAFAAAACAAGGPDTTASTRASTPRSAVAEPTTTRPTTTALPTRARVAGSAGCGRTPLAAGLSDETIISGGTERMFQLTVPAGYDGKTPLPVVLGMHALTTSHLFVYGQIGFAEMAERYRFIGVAPSGRFHDAIPFWFAAPTADNYDVAFISDLLDRLEADLCVDTARVFATGLSNGAQMSSVLACRLPERITAVAPVAGVEFSDACDPGPVAVVAFHGTNDLIIGYDGTGLTSTNIANVHYWNGRIPDGLPEHRGVDATMQTWARHNGCDPEPAEAEVAPGVRRRAWRRCRARTVLYVIDGGGHGWPEEGLGPGSTEVGASDLIFEFFLGHATALGGGRHAG